jgi:putrescine aminotransferase
MSRSQMKSFMNPVSSTSDLVDSGAPETRASTALSAAPLAATPPSKPKLGNSPASFLLEGGEKLAPFPLTPLIDGLLSGGGIARIGGSSSSRVEKVESLLGGRSSSELLTAPSDAAGFAAQALALVHKKQLSPDEVTRVTEDTVRWWRDHVNAGFLSYRKTMAEGDGGAALDWTDPYPGSALFEDARGNVYIDCLGGFGIFNVGRRNPVVLEAVQAQLAKQALHGQELLDPLRSYTAHLFAKLTPGNGALSHFFFVNSGAEAVEAALKMALLHTGRKHIIATVNAFHGKTLGALATTSKSVFRQPFLGSLLNVTHVPFDDLTHLRETFKAASFTGNDIAAFILEPIQGEGGIYVASDEYLRGARALCDEYGACLIFDEVQSGMGRSGKWFASEWSGVVPDLMAMGKAMGGGVMPVAACCGRAEIWKKYIENPFLLTTTFGGNPLALSAAIATVNVIFKDNVRPLFDRLPSVADGPSFVVSFVLSVAHRFVAVVS